MKKIPFELAVAAYLDSIGLNECITLMTLQEALSYHQWTASVSIERVHNVRCLLCDCDVKYYQFKENRTDAIVCPFCLRGIHNMAGYLPTRNGSVIKFDHNLVDVPAGSVLTGKYWATVNVIIATVEGFSFFPIDC